MKTKLSQIVVIFFKCVVFVFFLQAFLLNSLYANMSEKKMVGFKQTLVNISGIVTDENGQPLPGATVAIKNTKIGVVTNFDGEFLLDDSPEDAILVISYIGYTIQEVPVKGRTKIDVQLVPGTQLDEVVLIGYGSVKKRDLTGAVSRVDEKVLENQAQTQVLDMIAGRVAGVNINQSNTPGGSSNIEVRGPTSLTAGTSPLLVLDGAIYNGDIRDINPNDIESIDVLKDASSAAVFGSKAASGVIIISTKKGKKGEPTINISSKVSWSQVNNNDFRPRTGKEYEEFRRDYFRTLQDGQLPDYYWNDPNDLPEGVTLEQWRNAGNNPSNDNTEEYLNRLNFFDVEKEQYRAGREINWFDEVMRTGIITENDLSISGATDKIKYYWSLGQTDNSGIVAGDGFSTVRTRLNVDFEIANWLNVGVNAHFSERDLSSVRANLSEMFQVGPYARQFNEDGTKNLYPSGYLLATNPLENSEEQLKNRKQNNIFANIYAEVKLPLGIKYKFSYQPRYNWQKDYNFWDSQTINGGVNHTNGFGTRDDASSFSWLIDNLFTWNKELGKHRFDLTFLYNLEQTKTFESYMENENFFPNGNLGFNGLQFGINPAIRNNDTESSGNALLGRLNYNFDSRYFLTISVRRDGYSAFGQENPTAVFPAVAFAYTLSNEKFFNVDWINNLKFRASWGINGNRDIGIYSSLARVSSTQYSDGSNTLVGVYNSTLSNPGLRWERTEAINFGLDMAMLGNRINLTAEYYDTSTTDLLQARKLPEITGFGEITTNLGELANKGFELSINTRNITNPNFNWESSLVFSFNRNKIKSLFGDVDENGNPLPDYSNKWFPGQAIDVVWDYNTVGVWQLNQAEQAAEVGLRPGDYRAEDVDKSKTYDALIDKQFIGYETPRYRWGFTNDFTYKRLTASAFIRADIGHIGIFAPATHESSTYDRRSIANIPYWTPTNGNTEYARTSENRGVYGGGLAIYKSKSFVRLQDISLSYDFPISERTAVKGLRIFLSARNLLTFTKWPGWDPEGSDFPTPRTFTVGVNISL